MIRAAAITAAFAVMLLAGPAATSASASTTQARTGRITGLVTGHGRPLKGVCVFATELNFYFYETHTSKTGHYTLGSIAPGTYYVTFAGCASGPGNWLKQWYKGVNSPLGSVLNAPHGAVRLRVKAGKTLTGINGRLKLGGSISGVVTSAKSGAGLRRICVTANAGKPDEFDIEYTPRGGHYSLNALFPGSYQVSFGCGWDGNYNYAPQWWRHSATLAHATPVRITGAQNVRNIDGKLGPGAVITGTVRAKNASGPPLAGVCVNAVSSSPPTNSALVSTATDGSYRLAGLASAKYKVTFDPDCGGTNNYQGQNATVKTTAGTTTSGVNAYLQPTS